MATIAGLTDRVAGDQLGGILFLGLALTFGLAYLLPCGEARNRWAIYPAAVLLIMALLIAALLLGTLTWAVSI